MNNKEKGALGEEVAARYLIKNKHKILKRNFRTKSGEIDIISQHNGVIVFLEVKTRSNMKYGRPIEAIDYRKVEKIKNVATQYLYLNKFLNKRIRFDVIEIFLKEKGIRHVEDAF